ncbi:MAG: PilZ domain-containing protein [Desulfobacterales bacterium]
MEDRRKHERIDSAHLLYLCLKDDNDTVIRQGMGKILNLSEAGVRLQTHFPIEGEDPVWLSIGIEEDVVDVKGMVIYRLSQDGRHEFGIRFIEPDASAREILMRYISKKQKK